MAFPSREDFQRLEALLTELTEQVGRLIEIQSATFEMQVNR